MKSSAPLSDMITGSVLYCRMIEDIIVGETNLTLTEFRILFFLDTVAEKRARIHTLAEALYLSNSTVSDTAKDLSTKGFIEKTESQNDLKAVWAAITHQGKEELIRCCSVIAEYSQEYWDTIGPETAEAYLSTGDKLIETNPYSIQEALNLPRPASYAFITRTFLLSAVSWFKSTYNLSLLDVRILLLLLEHGRPLTAMELAHLLRSSTSSISNAVRRLSRVRQYLEREKDGETSQVEIALTPEGQKTASEIYERFVDSYTRQVGTTREEFEAILSFVHPRHRKSYMQQVFGEGFARE